MKHLDNLTIHRFRGLRDLTLQDLGQINLLVGGNNSGKTSVLEAISTYCRPLDIGEWLKTAERREIKASPTLPLNAFKWLFPQNNEVPKPILYVGETYLSGSGSFQVIESRAIYNEMELLYRSEKDIEDSAEDWVEYYDDIEYKSSHGAEIELKAIFRDPPAGDARVLGREFSEKIELWSNQRLSRHDSENNHFYPQLPIDMVTPVSHRQEKLESYLLSQAILRGLKNEVIKLLQIVDGEIIDLEILSVGEPRPSIYINHKLLGFSPLSAFGDGVRRLLFIALAMAKVRGGVLLIDEIETAIHTEALGSSFAWIVQCCKLMDVQLFATTHSLEAIDSMLDASNIDTDLVLYRLEKQESQTQAVRIERERLQRLREDLGQEVRV
ncbi:MAG: AAA family ATPase [Tychonema bourrellyi B0820]|uniref:ATPase n=1 Tax=Tychonema bourrellyi FEM_GT703 TaxID=2040638 RepID=A0A2G4EZE6_9CYAN|nr:ATP-binding protein [Tychonema bourrellyi]MDQ2100687.1 AAA family ATPase [Tychonema bourrellyi B0820]PHX54883.1 ATPase [Tychonema bourrellyi FEM_GT703]